MTIASTVTKKIYDADGVTRDWPITMETSGISSSEIKVYVTDSDGVSTVITSNYSVDLSALSVEYPTVASGLDPIASPNKVLLVRELALTQGTDYKNQGDLPAETIEEALDRLTEVSQQHQEQIDRSFKADISEDESDLQTLYDNINSAKTAAEAAQTAAELAQTGAETAQGLSEDAKDASVVAQGLAEDAQAAAEAAAATFTKATGAEINTGTDDAKYVTAKAIAESNVAVTSDIPSKATGAEIDTGTDDTKYVTAKAIEDSKVLKNGLGSWVDKTSSYGAQQASTDGFVVASMYGTTLIATLHTDSNANPTTIRGYIGGYSASPTIYQTCVMPVKSGDYWKMVVSNGNVAYVWWIPLS